jgi:hypothetical protein
MDQRDGLDSFVSLGAEVGFSDRAAFLSKTIFFKEIRKMESGNGLT